MRKRKWKSRKGAALLALALAFVLGLSGTGLLDTQAAGPVETERNCRLVIDTAALFETHIKNDYKNDLLVGHDITLEDVLESVTLTVNLYKVAEINASAKYTAVAPFNGNDVVLEIDGVTETFASAVSNVKSATTAETWEKMALATAAVTTKAQAKDTGTITGDVAEIEFGTLDGEEVVDGLEPGLYLVMVEDVDTPYYTYQFTPYLVSLPNNNYNPAGDPAVTDDGWVYNVEMGLKPEREAKTGSLKIVKDLTEMSLLPGNDDAMFVFSVEVDPLDPNLPEYMDYTAITFNSAGKREVTVADLPAGSTVRVTEVYSGGGYEQQPAEPNPAVEIIKADGTEGAPVTVTFTNAPDGTPTGGYGAINNLEPDGNGGWKWNLKTVSGSAAGEVKE